LCQRPQGLGRNRFSLALPREHEFSVGQPLGHAGYAFGREFIRINSAPRLGGRGKPALPANPAIRVGRFRSIGREIVVWFFFRWAGGLAHGRSLADAILSASRLFCGKNWRAFPQTISQPARKDLRSRSSPCHESSMLPSCNLAVMRAEPSVADPPSSRVAWSNSYKCGFRRG